MTEVMELKIIASRSPWISLCPYQISWNLQNGSKVISEGQIDSSLE
jgi:hypothetical protein